MKYFFIAINFALLILVGKEFIPTLVWVFNHMFLYQWMFYGFIAYCIVRKLPFFKRNEEWLQTFSHELSHAIVSLMFFRKIHSLHVDERSGVVWHSDGGIGDIFITLAPYCLPIFTYMFLLLRIIGDSKMLYVFDIFIGFTFAFHCFCFWRQTRLYQTDIQKYGAIRSFSFIATALLFNITIIFLSIRKGIVGSFLYLFPLYWKDIVMIF